MNHVHEARDAGQASRPLAIDITNPRALFVWINEARDAIDDLSAVAADALRAPRRRKLSKRVARERYQRATAAAVWLFSLKLDALDTAPAQAPVPVSADAIAASWEGWEA